MLENPHPDNPVMQIAWRDFLLWAFDQPHIRAAFESDTGRALPPTPRNGLESMIDGATGVHTAYAEAFAEWATVNLWGTGAEVADA